MDILILTLPARGVNFAGYLSRTSFKRRLLPSCCGWGSCYGLHSILMGAIKCAL